MDTKIVALPYPQQEGVAFTLETCDATTVSFVVDVTLPNEAQKKMIDAFLVENGKRKKLAYKKTTYQEGVSFQTGAEEVKNCSFRVLPLCITFWHPSEALKVTSSVSESSFGSSMSVTMSAKTPYDVMSYWMAEKMKQK